VSACSVGQVVVANAGEVGGRNRDGAHHDAALAVGVDIVGGPATARSAPIRETTTAGRLMEPFIAPSFQLGRIQ